jgi:signal transduction histidine kinase
MTPVLKLSHVSKHVGNQMALQQVSLQVEAGEVLGLADRTGMGKAALIHLLSGGQGPDAGEVWVNGRSLQWPFQPQKQSISILHQEPSLADELDVTSNIFLGRELGYSWLGWLQIPNQRKMDTEAARLLSSLDVRLPSLHEKAGNLSREQRQLVAVAQAMARPTHFILVDNPSRSLSFPYQEKLLDVIRDWQQQGLAVLFSSTNLDHLFAVSDRIVVLRNGRLVNNVRTDETNREEIVATMVGTDDRQQRTPVIWALDSYYRARTQAETLRHNQMLLERDLAAQGSLNQQLVNQLADQVRALDSANLALQDAQRRLLTEREEERKYLARELHDQMIQDLLSLNYQLEEMAEKVDVAAALTADFGDVRHHIRQMVEDLRRICGNLRPPTIDSLGLGAALQSYSHDWRERTGIEVTLKLDANFGRLPETIELSIFRIVQEGLNNVWKHANASQVAVTLQHTSPRMLLISLADDGLGLTDGVDLAALGQHGHYGLLGISERVALMGGRLNFQNGRDGGFLLQVEIPHPRVERSDFHFAN